MTHGSRPSLALLVGLAWCVTLGVSACGLSTPVDKQGAPVPAVTELSMGAADPQDAELAFFVKAVDQLSDHRLRVRVDAATYDSETPGGEAKLSGDVRAGAVALGYVPSRDLSSDGSPAFQALHAPFLLGSTSDAVALAAGPLAHDVLGSLDDRGVHGLALIPLESRRLLSRQPILGLGDVQGTRIRINDSVLTARLVSAWSAIPVRGYLAAQTKQELTAGRLDAVESSPSYIVPNAYFGPAPYLTSFGLFPKLEVLVANQQAWTRLSESDQAVLASAATQTLTHAVTQTPLQETESLAQLCARAVVVVRPPDEALKALSSAAAPAQPEDAQVTAWTARVRDFLGTVGVSGTSAPSGCPVATDSTQAKEAHSAASKLGSPSPTSTAAVSAFPVGTYTTFVTRKQWEAANVTSNIASSDITFTSTFRADGSFTQSLEPSLPDQGPYTGTWKATGDRLVLDYHADAAPSDRYVETVTWSYLRGELRFVVVDVLDTGSQVMYQQPWRKTG